jgi:YidC/Oxa1 family membrane protein insertase
MTDLRRTILWVVFTMSLVLIWDAWNRHNGQPTIFGMSSPRSSAAASAPGSSSAAGVPLPAATGSAVAAAPAGVPAATAAAPAAAPGQLVTVATDVLRATFDTVGGSLVKVELLKYRDAADPTRPVVLLDTSASRLYQAQTGFVASPSETAMPNHLSPLQWETGPQALAAGADALTVRFRSADTGSGVALTKTYTLHRGDYGIGVAHELANHTTAAIEPHLYLQLVRDGNAPPGESSFYSTFTGPAIYSTNKHFQKVDFKSIEKRAPGEAPSHDTRADNGWIAMVQHYFVSAWLVDGNASREFRTSKVKDNTYAVAMVLPLGALAPGQSKTHEATLLVAPQEEHKLAARADGLELVKDYGWLKILAEPLFWLLDKLHGVLGNWGWAIVALVVLLKIAFYWLNASAYRSMAKMKAVSPRITELRERMKDKPQEMQQEMMRIYREEKVNPLGGCLPIFAQMPFFISLYWVLLSSVEMRNAPWIGWIHDLSVRDPYFILPLLMTGSTMFQTWLSPTPPDPMQARLMWFMPLAFSVMFFFFPSGLVLYWLTNNVLSIAQQWFINKRLGVLKR